MFLYSNSQTLHSTGIFHFCLSDSHTVNLKLPWELGWGVLFLGTFFQNSFSLNNGRKILKRLHLLWSLGLYERPLINIPIISKYFSDPQLPLSACDVYFCQHLYWWAVLRVDAVFLSACVVLFCLLVASSDIERLGFLKSLFLHSVTDSVSIEWHSKDPKQHFSCWCKVSRWDLILKLTVLSVAPSIYPQ